jgi:hypothetical protein
VCGILKPEAWGWEKAPGCRDCPGVTLVTSGYMSKTTCQLSSAPIPEALSPQGYYIMSTTDSCLLGSISGAQDQLSRAKGIANGVGLEAGNGSDHVQKGLT